MRSRFEAETPGRIRGIISRHRVSYPGGISQAKELGPTFIFLGLGSRVFCVTSLQHPNHIAQIP